MGGEAIPQTQLSPLNADFIASFTERAGSIILLSVLKGAERKLNWLNFFLKPQSFSWVLKHHGNVTAVGLTWICSLEKLLENLFCDT